MFRMLRQHPVRTLSITALVALVFYILAGQHSSHGVGVWSYITGAGWGGFMLTVLVFIVFSVMTAVHRFSDRRRGVSG